MKINVKFSFSGSRAAQGWSKYSCFQGGGGNFLGGGWHPSSYYGAGRSRPGPVVEEIHSGGVGSILKYIDEVPKERGTAHYMGEESIKLG